MHVPKVIGRPVLPAIAVLILAGCSAGSVQSVAATRVSASSAATHAQAMDVVNSLPARGPGWILPEALKGPLLYAADRAPTANEVKIFLQSDTSKPVGKILAGINAPYGLFVDAQQNLYVTNWNNTVTVYHRGRVSPSVIYSQGLNQPIAVAVGKDGTVYVSDWNQSQAPFLITVYPKGSTTPSGYLTTGPEGGSHSGGPVQGLALDASNNLYASYRIYDGSGKAHIMKFPPGSTTGTDTGIIINSPGGLAFDKNGNLIADDQGGCSGGCFPGVIDVFPPGSTSPSLQISDGQLDPFGIALNRSEKRLYNADIATYAGVHIYEYPSGRFIRDISGFQQASGVATSPADSPF
jgi:hypothetical protein